MSAFFREAHPPPFRRVVAASAARAGRGGGGGRGDRPAYASMIIGAAVLVAVFALATLAARRIRGEHRADLRAYHGAPPVIPHAVESFGRGDCLACHPAPGAAAREALRLPDGSVAIATPHDFVGASCRQCHVEQDPAVEPLAPNGFAGAAEPLPLMPAYAGAPPVIPHGVFARSLCLACHGEGAYAAIATPHPERVSCRQCHVTRGELASRDPGPTAYAGNRFAEAKGEGR